MLEGRLGDFTLPDILRLLAFTAKSGRLWVTHGGTRARVGLLEGRIRDASADTAGLGLARRMLGQELLDGATLDGALATFDEMPTDLELARHLVDTGVLDAGVVADLAHEQVLDALFGLLRWPEGAFRFEAEAVEQRGPSVLDLALSVDDALEEVARRLEAHEAVEARTGDPDSVVTIRRPDREREVALSPEGWTLLALVDGHRTVADLVHLSGQGEYRTRRTLASLLDEGIVAVGDTAEQPPAERLVDAQRTLARHEARLADHADAGGTPAPTPATPAEPAAAPGEPASAHGEARSAATRTAPEASPPPADDAPTEPAAGEPPAAESPQDAPAADAPPERGPRRLTAQPGAAVAAEGPGGDEPAGVTPLRARAVRPQLRTDPEVDEELLQRLIDGVESL